jgi:hypothetical protein
MWMNEEVRSMNLQLDRALLRCDMSHIDVTDTSSIAREDYAWPAPKLLRQEEAHANYCQEGCQWLCVKYKQYSCYNPC